MASGSSKPREPRKNLPELYVDVHIPNTPRPTRRNSYWSPLTPGRRTPKSPNDRYSHHYSPYPKTPAASHPKSPKSAGGPRRRIYFCPDPPPQCDFRCGNPPTPGSLYCRNDTCRDRSCAAYSRVWGGYCAEHGCAAGGCLRRRTVVRLPLAEEGARVVERYAVVKYCGVHSCRALGCGRRGVRELVGFCRKHFGDYHDCY